MVPYLKGLAILNDQAPMFFIIALDLLKITDTTMDFGVMQIVALLSIDLRQKTATLL